MKLTDIERTHVGYLNTPLEFMPNLTRELGKGKLYVKRDDMTGLAMGGNKARKLDYLVKDALDHGYNALMTFGGVQTQPWPDDCGCGSALQHEADPGADRPEAGLLFGQPDPGPDDRRRCTLYRAPRPMRSLPRPGKE